MTTQSPSPRRAVLVVGFATIAVLASAGAASAEIPVGWSDPPPVPVLRDVLLLLGIPLLITFAIVGSIYLPGVIRGEKVAPAGARTDDAWFGGRRDPAALETAPASRSIEAGRSGGTDADRETGGAGGSW